MLDADLAKLYQVSTKVLNQAVKRNEDRFPSDFMFQLTRAEFTVLRSQLVTLESGRGQHRKYLPHAFTEQGVAMLSSVVRSKMAVQVNIEIHARVRPLTGDIGSQHKKLQTSSNAGAKVRRAYQSRLRRDTPNDEFTNWIPKSERSAFWLSERAARYGKTITGVHFNVSGIPQGERVRHKVLDPLEAFNQTKRLNGLNDLNQLLHPITILSFSVTQGRLMKPPKGLLVPLNDSVQIWFAL